MLEGMRVTKTPLEVKLEVLEKSMFKFHLTGSRYFRTNRIDSDWDFFAQDSQVLRDFLGLYGFKPEPTTKYVDSSLVRLYRCHNSYPHIDIQLVNDYQLKVDAQFILFNIHSPNSIDTALWNRAFHVVRNFR